MGFRTGQAWKGRLNRWGYPAMASESNTPSDGRPLSPRHRPSIGELGRDTTEMDLWDLDEAPPSAAPLKKRPMGGDGPAVVEQGVEPIDGEDPPKLTRPSPIKRNLPSRSSFRVTAGSTVVGGSDFEDLEEWVDEPLAPAEQASVAEVSEPGPAAPGPVMEDEGNPAPVGEMEEDVSVPEAAGGMDEGGRGDAGPSPEVAVAASPVDRAAGFRLPRLALSRLERVGLATFVVLMVGGGVFFLAQSIHRLPQEPPQLGKQDFPVMGRVVRVDSVVSYWREPQGEDVARRGTVLIPAVEVKLGRGAGAIRVFFNDEEGKRVGDPINREVGDGGTVKLAATAGFEEFSMHAAYRTGESKPWTIELFEGPSVNAPGADFEKLLEIPISSERR
jgi:hypothetical protein